MGVVNSDGMKGWCIWFHLFPVLYLYFMGFHLGFLVWFGLECGLHAVGAAFLKMGRILFAFSPGKGLAWGLRTSCCTFACIPGYVMWGKERMERGDEKK